MCGICGIINNSSVGIEGRVIKTMCSKMKYRGPDTEGVYISNSQSVNVGLGHRRLSIIDLSTNANQPMVNESADVYLTINGEIYNYKLLREDLKNKGHRFKSNTDSEVALHLYEEMGEEFVKYLRGAFAFAIWDSRTQKLILGRDRVGKKPLLYSNTPGGFCFASDFQAILSSNLIKKQINPEAIHYYLSLGYVPAPLTIYKNVFKLLPAQMLVLKGGQINKQIYWDLNYAPKLNLSLRDAEDQLVEKLKEAVSLRLYSDVPLGVFLSGGVDSSTIVALMAQVAERQIKTFSIGFGDPDFDELEHARRVAKLFNTDHHEFVVNPDALEVLPILVENYGEPYADSSCIPSYYVSKMARQHVTVALNGDGGDESFAGYERYQAVYLSEVYNRIPEVIRKAATAALLALLPDSLNFKNTPRRIRRFLQHAGMPFYSRYLHWVRMLSDRQKEGLYSQAFHAKVRLYDPVERLKEFSKENLPMELLDRLLYMDIKTNLANDLVVKMDVATMSNSLEARSPFLDQEVMEFCASLPVKFKMRNLVKKYLLKRVASKLIPLKNIRRKKMGFGVPVGYWMRNQLKSYVHSVLLSEKAKNRGYFKKEALEAYVKAHTAGSKDHSFGLWSLLMLELWHNKFID